MRQNEAYDRTIRECRKNHAEQMQVKEATLRQELEEEKRRLINGHKDELLQLERQREQSDLSHE